VSELREHDRPIWDSIAAEGRRQVETLELIASENFVSPAVLEAAGSVMTNKYAEGLPGKRYYGGCEFVDVAERAAIDRARELFGADHVNVQAHSGASANLGAYFAVSKSGDTLLGMSLADGGHLTHGHKVSVTGQIWNPVQYGVRAGDGLIDYDAIDALAREHRPRILVAGASAYSRFIDFERLATIAHEHGATLIVDMAHIAGLVAAGVHPSPVPHADIVTSTTHKTLRGPRGGFVIAKAELAAQVDKSMFPGLQGGPLMHVIAAKAVCFGEAATEGFRSYARRVVANAQALAEGLLGHGYELVSGGTDNHLMLLDLRRRGMTGRAAENALHRARITVNKNSVPNDPQKPWVTSGVRIGTPALTTRGMGEAEMRLIAGWMARVLDAPDETDRQEAVGGEVRELATAYPIFAWEPVLR
jgi:glycine hydroxymethyltransferase